MPGVFISHSSKDKEFVFKLAIDLLNLGFPVWLDAYELEVGSSLEDRIRDGIDASTHLIFVVSASSIASAWALKELELALEKERELNHPFVLPIRLDDCVVPPAIDGRIHVTFSKSYFAGLEEIENALRRRGADRISVPFEKQLVPLRMQHGLFVDEVALSRRITQINKQANSQINPQTSAPFQPSQFVLSPDPVYAALRAKFLQTLETAEADPDTPQDELTFLRDVYGGVRKLEKQLVEGSAEAVNHVQRMGSTLISAGTVVHWFVRICKSEALSILWRAQKEDQPIIPISPQVKHRLFADAQQTAEFYGVDRVFRYAVYRDGTDEVTSVQTRFDYRFSEELKTNSYNLQAAVPLWDAEIETLEKYLLPQIFFREWFSKGWTMEGCWIRNP